MGGYWQVALAAQSGADPGLLHVRSDEQESKNAQLIYRAVDVRYCIHLPALGAKALPWVLQTD